MDARYDDALQVMRALEKAGFAARLAGGCVRDRLLGGVPVDYDVATSARPQEVEAVFAQEKVRVVPTGVEHGTLTLVLMHGPVEVTTLRRDIETDGRHARVAFGSSFEDDAARRDFTINALFEDLDGKIYDYFGGQGDLSARRLRFVGDPRARIQEDYLRILRLFRFWARFGFAPAEGTLEAVQLEKAGLKIVSQERITSELWKTFAAEHPEDALKALLDTGIAGEVLPELAAASHLTSKTLGILAGIKRELRAVGVFAVWLLTAKVSTTCDDIKALGRRLRLSTVETKRLVFALNAGTLLMRIPVDVAASLDFVDECELAIGVGAFDAFAQAFLQACIAAEVFSDNAAVQRRLEKVSKDFLAHNDRRQGKLPIQAKDLTKAFGMVGAEIGEALRILKRGYRNGEWREASEGLRWLQEQNSRV